MSIEDRVLSLAWSIVDSANLGVIVRLGIAQQVPLEGTITTSNLAKATNIQKSVLERVVRYGIGNGIFVETSPGTFAHSEASRALATNNKLRDVIDLSITEVSSSLVKLPEALSQQRDQSLQRRQNAASTAFNLAYPEAPDVFDHFARNPSAANRYHRYMEGRAGISRWSLDHLRDMWDWSDLGSGTLVDLGGSNGHILRTLAPLCPHATLIIQDISPEALSMGRATTATEFPSLASRISFVQHDFFAPQPISADFYLLRHILHDWGDDDCVRILRALLPALKSGARVLISEAILPSGDVAGQWKGLDDKQVWIEDMFMLTMHGTKERTVPDFERLFTSASPDFRLAGRTGGNNGVFHSMLEFVYRSDGKIADKVQMGTDAI